MLERLSKKGFFTGLQETIDLFTLRMETRLRARSILLFWTSRVEEIVKPIPTRKER